LVVAHGDVGDVWPDLGDDAGNFVAQDGWRWELNLGAHLHLVAAAQPGCLDVHKNFVALWLCDCDLFWNPATAEFSDYHCFHIFLSNAFTLVVMQNLCLGYPRIISYVTDAGKHLATLGLTAGPCEVFRDDPDADRNVGRPGGGVDRGCEDR